MTGLTLKILIIGDQFDRADLELIEKVHGPVNEITIRALKSFSDEKDLLDYIKESSSTIYVTHGVNQGLIDSIKKSGRHVGVLMGHDTTWHNITGYGCSHSIHDLLSLKVGQGMICARN